MQRSNGAAANLVRVSGRIANRAHFIRAPPADARPEFDPGDNPRRRTRACIWRLYGLAMCTASRCVRSGYKRRILRRRRCRRRRLEIANQNPHVVGSPVGAGSNGSQPPNTTIHAWERVRAANGRAHRKGPGAALRMPPWLSRLDTASRRARCTNSELTAGRGVGRGSDE